MTGDTTTGEVLAVESELGPFGRAPTHGITHDGRHLWVATGDALLALEPANGEVIRTLRLPSGAGTAFDGHHLYQLDHGRIHKVDIETGEILASIPAPGNGKDSGLTWAEGSLWVGQYADRKIHRIDPNTGEILKTIVSDRFVTGVTWTGDELWYATAEGDFSDLRRVDPHTGEILARHMAAEGAFISGLGSDGERFFCGTGSTGRVRVVRRPG